MADLVEEVHADDGGEDRQRAREVRRGVPRLEARRQRVRGGVVGVGEVLERLPGQLRDVGDERQLHARREEEQQQRARGEGLPAAGLRRDGERRRDDLERDPDLVLLLAAARRRRTAAVAAARRAVCRRRARPRHGRVVAVGARLGVLDHQDLVLAAKKLARLGAQRLVDLEARAPQVAAH